MELMEPQQESVPAGYKRTEVGVIPADWEVAGVSTFGSIRTGPFGTLLKASEYSSSEGVPLISVGEIREGFLSVTEETPRVPRAVTKRLPQYLFREGDIVFGRKGGVDRSALITANQDGWFLGSDGISIRPSDTVHSPFVALQFQGSRVKNWLLQHAIGTTMPSLNQSILQKVIIPLPPTKAEQEAIAEALSDADAWIASLEQLIEKKRRIKQGAMQSLLTGKRRLPGFTAEWVERRLGDHVRFLRTGAFSRSQLSFEGNTRCLHYGDIHTSPALFLHPSEVDMPRLPDAVGADLDRLQDGDLIFADASEDIEGVGKSLEIANVGEMQVVSGLHTIAARFDKRFLADGYKAYLQFSPAFQKQLRRLAAGTKVYATTRTHIGSIELHLPSVEEQTAIAAVLSDMDAEIDALETKLAKVRQIKQGMMQELLTGRRRLV